MSGGDDEPVGSFASRRLGKGGEVLVGGLQPAGARCLAAGSAIREVPKMAPLNPMNQFNIKQEINRLIEKYVS